MTVEASQLKPNHKLFADEALDSASWRREEQPKTSGELSDQHTLHAEQGMVYIKITFALFSNCL